MHKAAAMRIFGSSIASLTLLLAVLPAVASAAEPEGEKPAELSYYNDIRPIFQTHCQGCHQPAKKSGEYVMTSFEGLLSGGESGDAAVTPGKPDESYLVQLITPTDGAAEMPKGKDPLAAADIERIRQWIEQGAKDDSPMSTRPQYNMDNPPVYSAAPVITSLDFSPDGKLLAVSGYHEVVLRSGDGKEVVARLVGMSERIEAAAFSPDGSMVAVTGGSPGRMGEVQVWDVAAKELKLALTHGYDTLYGASWSHDGKLIGFGCPDNTTRAIEAETGKQVLFSGAHNDWVIDTVFSVKSDHLVSVSRDQSVKLVHVPTQRFIDNITSITPGALKGGLHAVDRHPEKDEVLVGGSDGTPKIYKMYRDKARRIGDDFNLIRAFDPMPGRVFDVAFSRDGSRVVAVSSYNNTGEVRVYNTEDGKQLMKLPIDSGGMYAVAISPDGATVAAGGFDGEVRLINVADGKVINQFTPIALETAEVAASGAE